MINNLSHINERKTHVISIDVSSKIYSSFEEALKGADSLKDFVKRTCLKNDYSCVGFIGVSEYDTKFGNIVVDKFGKRIFQPSFLPNGSIKVNPHLHICLLANPASTLKDTIYKYFKKKYKQKVTWENEIDEYYENKIRYILDQSEKLRTININSDVLNPELDSFVNFIENKYNEKGNLKPLFPKISVK